MIRVIPPDHGPSLDHLKRRIVLEDATGRPSRLPYAPATIRHISRSAHSSYRMTTQSICRSPRSSWPCTQPRERAVRGERLRAPSPCIRPRPFRTCVLPTRVVTRGRYAHALGVDGQAERDPFTRLGATGSSRHCTGQRQGWRILNCRSRTRRCGPRSLARGRRWESCHPRVGATGLLSLSNTSNGQQMENKEVDHALERTRRTCVLALVLDVVW